MLHPLLSLLAAKAKVGAIVAGTALATTAVVGGGGTLVLHSVSDSSPVPTASVETSASPSVEASVEPSASPSVEASVEASASPSVEAAVEPAVEPSESPSAAVAGFVCDPSKNHGQNVSAYVHSLPKGPGRGELVSQAARSDCGKKVDVADAEEPTEVEAPEVEEPESEEPAETAKPSKPAKPAKPAKPSKPAKPGR